MGANRAEGKRSLREIVEDDEEDDDQQEGLGFTGEEMKKKGKKAASSGGAASSTVVCQVENCTADLRDAKRYHRRHKVCEFHAKSSVVRLAGVQQRFCQQCSRFHEIGEFDEAKRSCRRRLAGHNERRRKSLAECQGEGSNQMG